jgi:hypothetical protein
MAWKRSSFAPNQLHYSIRRILVVILSIVRVCRAHLPGGLPANAERASWPYSRGKAELWADVYGREDVD